MPKRRKLSKSALALLRDYGITEEAALYAGIFSVGNSKQEMRDGLEARAALAIPYFDIYGEPVTTAPASLYFPRVRELDWVAISDDTSVSIVIVNDELRALALCVAGIPSIAFRGISETRLTDWLRERGAICVRTNECPTD